MDRPEMETRAPVTSGANLIALDCEMVVGRNRLKMLARVSMVNCEGETVYDTFVKPRGVVVDYRTHVSGVRKEDFVGAKTFKVVRREVAEILKGNVLVGHALKNDLRVLHLSHSKALIRDTAEYEPFNVLNGNKTPSLKFLAKEILNRDIQDGEHDSIIDAKTCMLIYRKCREEWEAEIMAKYIQP